MQLEQNIGNFQQVLLLPGKYHSLFVVSIETEFFFLLNNGNNVYLMKEVGSLITVTSLLAMKNTLATVAIIVPSNSNSRVTGQVSLAFLNPVKSLVLITN